VHPVQASNEPRATTANAAITLFVNNLEVEGGRRAAMRGMRGNVRDTDDDLIVDAIRRTAGVRTP